MYSILIKSLLLFFLCQCVHIFVWRVKRPTHYRVWVLTLSIIFIPLGGLGAFGLVKFPTIFGDDLPPPEWIEWLAIFLFQSSLSIVYLIGYTAIAAFSPSMELMKTLERVPEGLPREKLTTPFFEDIALSDSRINNLIATELLQKENGYLYLTQKGQLITRPVLFYRYLLGLPDGEGG